MGTSYETPASTRINRLRRLVSDVQTTAISRRLRNSRSSRTIKYDVEVPRGTRDAMLLDQRNNNKHWYNAIQKELGTMAQYKVFDKRLRKTLHKNFKYIPVHFVYDVKSDGTPKACLVAGGNVIKSPDCPLYSTVVKTESVRTIVILAAKQKLQVITGDMGGAYLKCPMC